MCWKDGDSRRTAGASRGEQPVNGIHDALDVAGLVGLELRTLYPLHRLLHAARRALDLHQRSQLKSCLPSRHIDRAGRCAPRAAQSEAEQAQLMLGKCCCRAHRCAARCTQRPDSAPDSAADAAAMQRRQSSAPGRPMHACVQEEHTRKPWPSSRFASSTWWLSIRSALGTTMSGTPRESASKVLPAPQWLMTRLHCAMSAVSAGRYSSVLRTCATSVRAGRRQSVAKRLPTASPDGARRRPQRSRRWIALHLKAWQRAG